MKFLSNTSVTGKVTSDNMSYVGQIIFSGTLSTMDKVISIYGGTKWVPIEGKFLLGASSAYPVNTTGGEATHKLTVSEMPTHTHSQFVAAWTTGDFDATIDYDVDQNTEQYEQLVNTLNVGGDQTHNNMPPYRSIYIWKRTE